MKYTREYLDKNMNYGDVKNLLSSLGFAPGNRGKEELINIIIDYQEGKIEPKKSKRGRPRKTSVEYPSDEFKNDIVSSGEDEVLDYSGQTLKVTGTFEKVSEDFGFLRGESLRPSPYSDVYVSKPVIREYKLKQGDYIEGVAVCKRLESAPSLKSVTKINGLESFNEERKSFENLTPDYPREKFELLGDLSVIDLFSPLGKGQRALIVAEPKAGKTTMLKKIAENVLKDSSVNKVILLLIGERPEEVTDLKQSLNAEIIYSTFDEDAERHVKIAEIALDKAKRIAENGGNAVILVDSLTRLTRAYNELSVSSGKTMSGGIDYGALSNAKKFFGSARNLLEGGSLTIIATCLVNTGSKMDDVIYEEFKGTGNSEIVLKRSLCERRIFPPVDVILSGTRKEELLLDEKTLASVYKIRRTLDQNQMIKVLERSSSAVNAKDLLDKIN
ncbi:MAG: transcription termination factor Rho [Clostridia bacterium]|nr:transcription termination factor Rho [Clostridia bacterium]